MINSTMTAMQTFVVNNSIKLWNRKCNILREALLTTVMTRQKKKVAGSSSIFITLPNKPGANECKFHQLGEPHN